MIVATVLLVLLAGGAIVAYVLRTRRRAQAVARPARWTDAAGDDFAGLSESGRCDLIFALAALDDAASLTLLENALDDPSETVALAAAHALTSRGGGERVQRYFAAHPDQRAARIAQTFALLDRDVSP